jgi:dipeptidyl aminopeptidase/acylaminoacyl peptidase
VQVLGLQHLMKTEQFIDPARIGVTGWSYGGYLSLCFLAQRPDFFKVRTPVLLPSGRPLFHL